MTEVLKFLPHASWRDIIFPVMRANASFSHENVDHKFAYRNDDLIEPTGARSWTFRYEVPIRTSIAKGPYQDLFTKILPDLVNAIRDKSEGILVDPVYGVFQCVPSDFSSQCDAERRDGVDLSIEFRFSPDLDSADGAAANQASIDVLANEAKKMDEEIAVVDWEQEIPPEPTVDPLSFVAGAIRQGEFAGNKVLAGLERFIDRAEAVERAVDALSDPNTFALKRRARRTREAAVRAQQQAMDPFKPLRVQLTETETTVSELAYNMSVDIVDLIKANPNLARNFLVPPGVTVNVPQRKVGVTAANTPQRTQIPNVA